MTETNSAGTRPLDTAGAPLERSPGSSSPQVKTLAPFRLRKHPDYQRVYKASRKHFSSSMAYFFRVRPPEESTLAPQPSRYAVRPGPRVGLTVGRVMGKAVDRNRIKRRMREAVRLHLESLGPRFAFGEDHAPSCDIDLVLHPKKSVATMEFAALEAEVAKLFAKVVRQAAEQQAAPAAIPAKPESPSSAHPNSRPQAAPLSKPQSRKAALV